MKNSPTETFKHGIAKPVLPAVFFGWFVKY